MERDEATERSRVVDIARTWLGTPYHHRAKIKGIGVDCALILSEVFQEAGLVSDVLIPPYSPMWHLSRDEERYAEFIERFAVQVRRSAPKPGDIIVWKFHKCFAHGGIVTEWPNVIHAFMGRGVFEDDALANQMLTTISERVPDQGKPRPHRFYSVWGH